MEELSIIVPVRGSSPALRRCLEALERLEPPPLEILVVNDGADPLVREVCRRWPVRHLEIEPSRDSAASRNFGALHSGGDLLLFLDPETLVQSDVVAQIEEAFLDNPHLSALVGSFDEASEEPNFFSQYETLSIHYAHRKSARSTDVFCPAFGAIRRDVFFVLGGFDHVPSEGLELGHRLRSRDFEIELRPELLAKSMKRWHLAESIHATVFQRAIPSAELLWRSSPRLSNLEIHPRATLSWAAAAALLPLLVASFFGTGLNWVALSLMPLWIALNWSQYSYFLRRRGAAFTARAIAWHGVTSFLKAVGFGAGSLRAWARPAPVRETFLHEVPV